MSGPSDSGLFFVLVGRVERLTIWPVGSSIPADWRVAFGPGTHQQCEEYVERHRGETHPKGVPATAWQVPERLTS
ncbi:MbtH family NRPS accessory protein [Flexivirga sp. ID2601S]|uniref:MbtH family NRPS accessory protein n=1 Tax=Flexivirga aerilata TaxID=1656889 RepID=A0A849AFH8_9MICO|nr:MbtH family NRPS accessory protein [Flexivirga aerilata]NNG38593.1 MbtH family NRPS accessory protein [Flexivirga aerilata]